MADTLETHAGARARFVVLSKQPIDRDAFEQHYRDVHIPLAKKLSGLRRYAIAREPRTIRGQEYYYIIAQLDWDDMAALQRDFASPTGQETAQDVEKLARLTSGVQSFICEFEEV
jgi:uncharacterized protein (TIGR02118 family)